MSRLRLSATSGVGGVLPEGRWLAGIRRDRVTDVALAVLVATAMVVLIATASEEPARPRNAYAYLLGIGMGAAVLLRTRPVAMLVSCLAVLAAYYALDYPGVAIGPPLCVPLYAIAAAGRLRLASAVVAGGSVVAVGWRLLVEREPLLSVVGTSILLDVLLLGAVVLLGDAVHSRRRWRDEATARVRLVEEAREREAKRRVEEERLRIARELHDVLAHTIAVISVHAGVAADMLAEEPARAREALRTIRAKSREATTELKATLGVLRHTGPSDRPRDPAPGLARLDDLLKIARGAGVAVRLESTGEPRPLPTAVEVTAYRVIQESLTNALRHAGASSVGLRLHYEPGALVVEVDDDGRGADSAPGETTGYGLAGMRERVTGLGGALTVGQRGDGVPGFAVRAELPLPEAQP